MPVNPLSHHFASRAYNNAWANHRLSSACAGLSPAEYVAPRTSFFPSIQTTLNHLLAVDLFYIDALEREARGDEPHPDHSQFFTSSAAVESCAKLWVAQQASDVRLISYCQALEDTSLHRKVRIDRGESQQAETRTRLLSHLFEHQTHHRGQVHAMLSGTPVMPPQLDEFFCDMDKSLRAKDLVKLGLREADIWPDA